ncbi:hypothetical protein HMPREF9386_0167 [Streptococcus sanguinis SK330]|uniref:Uncharacterized protein n=1 Tax=Streptococcus sanguinis SK330 TaxID=888813 RepID=F2C514_STRSA|nr:hypothetical protein HMPREF9386_0167 [Streptococcus sanguinis SK330]
MRHIKIDLFVKIEELNLFNDFSLSVHYLACFAYHKGERRLTSSFSFL